MVHVRDDAILFDVDIEAILVEILGDHAAGRDDAGLLRQLALAKVLRLLARNRCNASNDDVEMLHSQSHSRLYHLQSCRRACSATPRSWRSGWVLGWEAREAWCRLGCMIRWCDFRVQSVMYDETLMNERKPAWEAYSCKFLLVA